MHNELNEVAQFEYDIWDFQSKKTTSNVSSRPEKKKLPTAALQIRLSKHCFQAKLIDWLMEKRKLVHCIAFNDMILVLAHAFALWNSYNFEHHILWLIKRISRLKWNEEIFASKFKCKLNDTFVRQIGNICMLIIQLILEHLFNKNKNKN